VSFVDAKKGNAPTQSPPAPSQGRQGTQWQVPDLVYSPSQAAAEVVNGGRTRVGKRAVQKADDDERAAVVSERGRGH
jgi:hypothetical protein